VRFVGQPFKLFRASLDQRIEFHRRAAEQFHCQGIPLSLVFNVSQGGDRVVEYVLRAAQIAAAVHIRHAQRRKRCRCICTASLRSAHCTGQAHHRAGDCFNAGPNLFADIGQFLQPGGR